MRRNIISFSLAILSLPTMIAPTMAGADFPAYQLRTTSSYLTTSTEYYNPYSVSSSNSASVSALELSRQTEISMPTSTFDNEYPIAPLVRGGTGTPGNSGILQPVGDALVPLCMLLTAYLIFLIVRKRKNLQNI